MLDLSVQLNLIQKSGAWFSHNGEKIGQGRENAKNYLKENQKLFDELKNQVLVAYSYFIFNIISLVSLKT